MENVLCAEEYVELMKALMCRYRECASEKEERERENKEIRESARL